MCMAGIENRGVGEPLHFLESRRFPSEAPSRAPSELQHAHPLKTRIAAANKLSDDGLKTNN
jgi:hypothetical protein